ncbi:MAG: hypothetical protein ACI92G_000089 [Candidatus Pelagisphaera sp.]|jgi:hypothetical protein
MLKLGDLTESLIEAWNGGRRVSFCRKQFSRIPGIGALYEKAVQANPYLPKKLALPFFLAAK